MGALSEDPGGSLVWLQACMGLALLLCINDVQCVKPRVTIAGHYVDIVLMCLHVINMKIIKNTDKIQIMQSSSGLILDIRQLKYVVQSTANKAL